jgi:hypothetical protein
VVCICIIEIRIPQEDISSFVSRSSRILRTSVCLNNIAYVLRNFIGVIVQGIHVPKQIVMKFHDWELKLINHLN